jgi:hypothetical protein
VIVARSTWANATLESANVSSATTVRILLMGFLLTLNHMQTLTLWRPR